MTKPLRIILALWPVALLAFAATVSFASHVDDFDYNLPVCATNNSGSTLTNAPVVATINADELSDGGFTQNSFADTIAVNPNQAHVSLFIQEAASATADWWIEMDTIGDTQTRCWEIHMGSATATRDLGVHIFNTSSTTEDLAGTMGGSGVFLASVTLDAFTPIEFPTSGSVSLLATTGGARLTLNSTGVLNATWQDTDSDLCTTTATLTEDETVNIRAVGGIGGQSDGGNGCHLVIDGVEVAEDFNGLGQLGNFAASYQFGGVSGFAGSVGRYSFETDSTIQWDLTFGPSHCSQTQQGAAGNSWTWTGMCQDQSGSNNDGTYTFVRPYMASVTVDVEPLISKAALPTVLVIDDITDVVGDLPDVSTTTSDENFPGRDAIQEAIDFAGGPTGALWFGFAVGIGIALGALTVWATHFPLWGFLVLGGIVGAGGATGTYNLWLAVGIGILCFAAGGAMAFADVGRR